MQRAQRKGGLLQQALLQSAGALQGDPEGPDQTGFGRHQDAPPGERGHGGRDRPVVADPALHEDGLAHRAAALHAVVVIHADRIDQAGEQVGPAHPFMGRVLEVAADEGGALVAEIGWGFPLQGECGDLIEPHTQRFVRCLLKE